MKPEFFRKLLSRAIPKPLLIRCRVKRGLAEDLGDGDGASPVSTGAIA